MPTIRISDELYSRLSSHASGFDTPANVIERLLNHFEEVDISSQSSPSLDLPKPELAFIPDEESFKASLVAGRTATRVLYFSDGSSEKKDWNAARFSESSNLRGNIWSGPLRGWKTLNIVKAEFIAGTN